MKPALTLLAALSPDHNERRGLKIGVLGLAVWMAVVAFKPPQPTLGVPHPYDFVMLIAVLTLAAVWLLLTLFLIAWVLTVLHRLPRLLFWSVIGIGSLIAMLWPPPVGPLFGGFLVLVNIAIALLIGRLFREGTFFKRILNVIFIVATNAALCRFLWVEQNRLAR
jgi:hypothetical protein